MRFAGGDLQRIVHIEVRDGAVAKCLENERPPSQKNYWDDWTIANQFALIGSDLDKSDDPANGFRVKDNVVITLFAEFDPQYGYPVAYNRKAARSHASAIAMASVGVQAAARNGSSGQVGGNSLIVELSLGGRPQDRSYRFCFMLG